MIFQWRKLHIDANADFIIYFKQKRLTGQIWSININLIKQKIEIIQDDSLSISQFPKIVY